MARIVVGAALLTAVSLTAPVAGSKLSYPDTGTCAVTELSTVCVVGDHGFELSEQGSRVF